MFVHELNTNMSYLSILICFPFSIYLSLLLFLACSSLSRGDPLLEVSADLINEVVRESASQLVHATVDEMVQGHMTVIRAGDWLEDFILEAITPMLPRVVGTFFFIIFFFTVKKVKLNTDMWFKNISTPPPMECH